MAYSSRSGAVALLFLALMLALLLLEVGALPVAGQTSQIVDVTIESAPETGPGFIWVDNVFVSTPITYSWYVGDTHLLTAAIETRIDNDCSAHQCDMWFQSWSDNGYRNHTITVIPSTTFYTVFFLKRDYVFVSGSPAEFSDIDVDNSPISSNPQFFGWSPGSTHQLTAHNTRGQFVYWAAPSFTQIYMNAISYTVPTDGENVTAYYIPQTSTTTTTTVSTTSSNTQQITVTSDPTSVGIISVDGASITTPQTFTWQIGTTHILFAQQVAPCLNVNFACSFTFQNWFAQSSRYVTTNSFIYTVPSWSETIVAFYQQTPYQTSTSTTLSSTTASTTSQSVDFSLSMSPSTVSLPPSIYAGATDFTLILTSVSGWSGQVQFATSSLPQGITLTNMPTSYQLTSSTSWNVAVNIGASAPSGSYPLVITAISASLVHSAVVTIVVSNQSTAVPEFPLSELGTLAACLISVAVASRRYKATLKKFSSTRK